MFRAIAKSVLIVGAAVLLALQLLPPEFPRDNPPVTAPLDAPEPVTRILERSCYDCHSHETRWPWYAWVAPASWTVTRDVAAGRSRMNFSTWGDLRDGFRRRHARKIVERVEAGEMPPARYRLLHPEAGLTPAELDVLRRWSDDLLAPASAVDREDAPGS